MVSNKLLPAVILLILIGVSAVGLWHTKVHAAGQGIIVSPALQDITISEADSEVSFEFNLTNKNPVSHQVKLSALDFEALDESGGVAFLGRTANGQETKYGLKNWLTFSQDMVVLEPGQRTSVRAIITNRAALGPGGHYGAVIVTPVEQKSGEGANKVDIVPSSSILVFLKKSGGERYELNLSSLTANHSLFRFPTEVALRFQNAGNVHVVPRGLVSVTNSYGKQLARGPINSDSGIILPDTFRKYPTPLNSQSRLRLPGRYTIRADYRYDGSDMVVVKQISFLYIGPVIYWALLLLVFVIGGILFHRRLRRRAPSKKNK